MKYNLVQLDNSGRASERLNLLENALNEFAKGHWILDQILDDGTLFHPVLIFRKEEE